MPQLASSCGERGHPNTDDETLQMKSLPACTVASFLHPSFLYRIEIQSGFQMSGPNATAHSQLIDPFPVP
jgi:hypothetical protein